MNAEELSFFNRQLAGLLKCGIPLEGALADLARSMNRGPLRTEVMALEKDLASGISLDEAVSKRKFPEVYRTVLNAGAKGRDLPGFLLLLADYYQRTGDIARRLQGLMIYPLIVLIGSLGLAFWMSVTYTILARSQPQYYTDIFSHVGASPPRLPPLFGMSQDRSIPVSRHLSIWAPPVFIFIVCGVVCAALSRRTFRNWAHWNLPAFKEARLTQFAESMALLLRGGVPLPEALRLMRVAEDQTPAATDLTRWIERLAEGRGRFVEMTAGSRAFPPLFLWLVAAEGEDLASGFARAAEIYRGRATYRSELLLQAALPAAVLLLGLVIMAQVVPWVGELQTRISEFLAIFQLGNIVSPKR